MIEFVVIPILGGQALAECLASLVALEAVCLVVCATKHEVLLPRRQHRIRIALADENVPRRRALGLELTHSTWVAFIEDTCSIAGSWAEALEDISLQSRFDAVGGPIELSVDLPPRCMALGCLEYGAYEPEKIDNVFGPAHRIAGLSMIYRRDALRTCDLSCGLIESEVNASIARNGRLAMHPRLAVTYDRADDASATLGSRLAHGRIYGDSLRRLSTRTGRLFAAVKCLALPIVLAARALCALPSRYRCRSAAAWWIVAFAFAWSIGELAGVIRGRADSLSSWQ